MRRPAVAAVAIGTALAMGITACGGGDNDNDNKGGGNANANAAAYNAGVGKVFKPSDAKGGTIRYANSGDFDSLDPADMYYGYAWDFVRYYGRSLVMFQSKPGADGNKLVPDLAESLGTPTDDAKTWTYKIKSGIKYEDGSPVTTKDIKYAVERALDKNTFPNGPTYFNDVLDLQGYTSPYKDSTPDKLGLKAIDTPDDQTIVFHLNKSFSTFDYLAMLPITIPVPRAKDTGTKYKEHVVSTGPYMFETNNLGKNFTLVRNPNWDAATDPNRKALPDRIEMALNTNADDIDNRLLAGDLDVFVEGTGLGAAGQGRVLADQNLKKNADNASLARTWFTSLNADVAPLDNIHCRKAVLLAADHEGYQRAYGGPVTGGDVATSLLPPVIPGHKDIDLYNFKSKPTGDVDAAKAELQQCGQPNGFATNISYRSERPKEKATAESLQQSLAKVGIKLTIKPFPQGDYFKLYAGKPAFAKANGLGIMVFGWGADWPDGFGFLSQIVDSRAIREAGNTNLGIKIPEVDALLDQALKTTDTSAREALWGQIDEKVMENAYALPGVWAKVLHYRPATVSNVYVNEGLGGYYDYVNIGVK
jgi:peptide/nickel transport system substrate-binding protein